jgi:hypothetical protein
MTRSQRRSGCSIGRQKLGLPPGAQTAQARAEATRLRHEVESRRQSIETAASRVKGGDIAAIGAVLTDLQNDQALAPQVVNELRHVVTVDLGLSLAEASVPAVGRHPDLIASARPARARSRSD